MPDPNMPPEAGKLLDAYRRYVEASRVDAVGFAAGTESAARAADTARDEFSRLVRQAPTWALAEVFAVALEAVSLERARAGRARGDG